MTTEEKFMKVYDENADGVFRFCFFRVYDRELARDLTQDAFMKTWKCLVDGQNIQNLRAFVYKVARNLVIDNSRKKKELSLEDVIDNADIMDTINVQKDTELKLDYAQVLEKLERLKPEYQEVILMRFIEELKPAEIAEILGETANAVSIRITRAVGELREIASSQIPRNDRRAWPRNDTGGSDLKS